MYLNFSNVEEIIFYNKEVQQILPPYMSSYFEQWKLAKQIPTLRQMGKKAMLDFLDHLDESHISILENYFNESVSVGRINYKTVMNLKIPIDECEICEKLFKIEGFDYFDLWRDQEYLYVSFWK